MCQGPLIEVFILGLHYDPPSTGRIQQLDYNTIHKQGATELLGNYITSTC